MNISRIVRAFLLYITGTLIRRHRVPKPPPNDDEFYTIEDFNVGKEISLYSKVFKITNCDEFTANFLRKLGVKVNVPADLPGDPYTKYRKAVSNGCFLHRLCKIMAWIWNSLTFYTFYSCNPYVLKIFFV